MDERAEQLRPVAGQPPYPAPVAGQPLVPAAPVLEYRSAPVKDAAPVLEPGEVAVYSDATVLVSDVRLAVGSRTYAMEHVVWVELMTVPETGCSPLIGLAAGIFLGGVSVIVLLANGARMGWSEAVPMGLLMVLGAGLVLLSVAAMWRPGRCRYVLVLATTGGQFEAVSDRDEPRVRKIKDAVDQALVRRNSGTQNPMGWK